MSIYFKKYIYFNFGPDLKPPAPKKKQNNNNVDDHENKDNDDKDPLEGNHLFILEKQQNQHLMRFVVFHKQDFFCHIQT